MTNIWMCLSFRCSFELAMVQIRVNIHFYVISKPFSIFKKFRPSPGPQLWTSFKDWSRALIIYVNISNDNPSYSCASSSLYQSRPRSDFPSQSLHRLKLITAPVFCACIHCGLEKYQNKDFKNQRGGCQFEGFGGFLSILGDWVSFWQFYTSDLLICLK